MNWKPIESAPRDGTYVWLRHPAYGKHRMGWNKVRNRWEGMVFMPLHKIDTWWDVKVEQPTEWAEIETARPTDREAMTKEEQRIKIAEFVGWRKGREIEPNWWVWFHPNGEVMGQLAIPDYPNDLDAMHEAEKLLEGKLVVYLCNLDSVCGCVRDDTRADQWLMVTATAAQRAEAFIRTITP